tara:strand:- start:3265 stop:3537 length:273 start_codon:yes stop_codon:yes gene_type:complete
MSELSIDEQFDKSVIIARNIVKKISNCNIIQLYAYCKQAREGNISFEKPSILNMNYRQKWKSWKKLENMSSENAKIHYINLIKSILVDIS